MALLEGESKMSPMSDFNEPVNMGEALPQNNDNLRGTAKLNENCVDNFFTSSDTSLSIHDHI
jgi:hypothetical protein